VGDAGFRLDGRHLSITLPGGTEHDLWPGRDRAARLLQPTADVDLDIIAKFSTIPTQPYQVQGLLFSEDSNNWLRADFYSDGSKLYVFAATVDNGAVQIRIPQQIINPTGADLYLRVTRVADLWSQYYSFDGQQWTKSGSFTYSFVVRSAGLFAANAAGANSPPFTSTVDYFMNTAAPITDEDGDNLSLSVKVVGNGRVEPTPDKGEYSCGEVVTLTAVPDTGWSFAGWGGKVTTSTNPLVVNFGIGDAITSTFTALPQYQVNVATTGEGNVGRMPEKATYEPGEAVTLVAAPAEGWLFDGWQGDVQSSDNPLVLTMNGDLAVTATFVERPLLRLYLPLIAKPQ
jgi:regulation of enolase protein 1 (concanavalin A-like superfamily)